MNDDLLETIKLAFETASFVPIRRCFFLREGSINFACPIVTLAVYRGVTDKNDPNLGNDEAANIALEWASSVFGEEFIWGLLSAWDAEKKVKNEPDFNAGYDLGLEAAKTLMPHDPPD